MCHTHNTYVHQIAFAIGESTVSSPGPSLRLCQIRTPGSCKPKWGDIMTHAHFHGDLGGKLAAAAVGVSLDRSLSGSLPGELD